MFKYANSAKNNGIDVIIAGAGGAAHLPGMVASITTLPVIGVPVKSRNSIDGWDSVLSILQMPNGVPVATVALNGSKNAGILAAQMVNQKFFGRTLIRLIIENKNTDKYESKLLKYPNFQNIILYIIIKLKLTRVLNLFLKK